MKLNEKTCQVILTAIEFAAMHVDGPDEPGFYFNGVTILDADPKTGLILAEDAYGEKRAYKIRIDESDLDVALERWQEKTGG
jgi:hypothetical protein